MAVCSGDRSPLSYRARRGVAHMLARMYFCGSVLEAPLQEEKNAAPLQEGKNAAAPAASCWSASTRQAVSPDDMAAPQH